MFAPLIPFSTILLAQKSIARTSAWKTLGHFPSPWEISQFGPKIPKPELSSIREPSVYQTIVLPLFSGGLASFQYSLVGITTLNLVSNVLAQTLLLVFPQSCVYLWKHETRI